MPCPTCWLPADVTVRLNDALPHTSCPRGHDNALAPVVLDHLRSLGEHAR